MIQYLWKSKISRFNVSKMQLKKLYLKASVIKILNQPIMRSQ
jgi:hypothetical protein